MHLSLVYFTTSCDFTFPSSAVPISILNTLAWEKSTPHCVMVWKQGHVVKMLKEDCEFLSLYQCPTASFPFWKWRFKPFHFPLGSVTYLSGSATTERETVKGMYLSLLAMFCMVTYILDILDQYPLPPSCSLNFPTCHCLSIQTTSLAFFYNCGSSTNTFRYSIEMPSVAMVLALEIMYNCWLANLLNANTNSIRSSKLLLLEKELCSKTDLH